MFGSYVGDIHLIRLHIIQGVRFLPHFSFHVWWLPFE